MTQANEERNYHVFYEILKGLSREQKELYGLTSAEKYFYLNQGGNCSLQSDSADFTALMSAFQILGFGPEEIDVILRILAGGKDIAPNSNTIGKLQNYKFCIICCIFLFCTQSSISETFIFIVNPWNMARRESKLDLMLKSNGWPIYFKSMLREYENVWPPK